MVLNWRLSSFYFIYFSTLGVIVPYWGLWLQSRGFNATQIGELMAIMLATKVFAPYIWASIADHITLRRGTSLMIVKFATGLTVLLFSLLFVFDSFAMTALLTFAYCLFWNATLPQLEAATLNYLDDHQEFGKHGYGRIRLWGSVGFIVTALVVGILVDFYGAQSILISALSLLIVLFVASFFVLDKKQVTRPDAFVSKIPIHHQFNRQLWLLFLVCFLMQASHAPFYSFFSIYLEQAGYSKTSIGWLWSVGVILEIVVFIYGYLVLRKISLTTLLSFTFMMAAIRWWLVAEFPHNGALILFSQMLHAITYGLYHTVMIQIVDHYFKGQHQIRGQALYSSVTFGLGGALGSVASGIVWIQYGAEYVFLFASMIMIFAFLISASLIKQPIGKNK